MSTPRAHARSYPTSKKALVGSSHTAQPTPAWKQRIPSNREGYHNLPPESGSKVLISQLPQDVGEAEIDDLLNSTVGPLHDVFIVHNSAGKSKGMAIVHFKRGSDAARAREKYNGKLIDGQRPLKIELITNSDTPIITVLPPTRPLTLKERLSQQTSAARQPPPKESLVQRTQPSPAAPRYTGPPLYAAQEMSSRRLKKGPRRVKKRERVRITFHDLDREMDDYKRAGKFGDAS